MKEIKRVINLHKIIERNDVYNFNFVNNNSYEKNFKYVFNEIDLKTNKNINNKISLYDILKSRKSYRNFKNNKKISFEDLSNILFYSSGVKNIENNNFFLYSQSTGNLKPFNIYIYLQNIEGINDGLYYYSYIKNKLLEIKKCNVINELKENHKLKFPINANINLFIVADLSRVLGKYGIRSYRFINIDAGILSENICLITTYLNLNSCIVGTFSNINITKNLKLNENEIIILSLCIGV